jgi:hypothetical protein
VHLGVRIGLRDALPRDQQLGVLAPVLGHPLRLLPDAAEAAVVLDELLGERGLAGGFGPDEDDARTAPLPLIGAEFVPVFEGHDENSRTGGCRGARYSMSPPRSPGRAPSSSSSRPTDGL